MGISFTPEALQKIAYSTFPAVLNRMAPIKADRRRMPGLAMFADSKSTAPTNGAYGPIIKYQVQSNIDLQGWERKDPLLFAEQTIELDTQFPFANVHHGWEIVHDDIEAAVGGTVMPNQYPRGKNIVRADSEADAFRLVNWMTAAQEAFMDKRNVNLDQLLWRSNSADPKLPTGWDGYWPRAACTGMTTDSGGTYGYYNLGSLGGRLRSQYPDVLQHYVWLNATSGAGGSLRKAFNSARYEAELRSRGRTKSGIKMIQMGRRAAEKYVNFATTNNWYVHTDATGTPKLDIGIPTSGLEMEGIPIVINPTFKLLDAIENPTYKWDDCAFLIDMDAFELGYANGKENVFSTPPDESDQRISRFSLDDKLVLLPKVPNAIAVVHFA